VNVEVAILATTSRGAQVVIHNDTGAAFWLPTAHPAVVWSGPPSPGAVTTVRVPTWLVEKHGQLRQLRNQQALRFHEPLRVDLDPAKARGPIPMAYDQNERPPQARGALFINKQKQQPNHPDRRGDLTLPAGYVLTLANGTALTLPAEAKLEVVGWLKDTKAGEKYLSLSAKPFQERQQQAPRERYDQHQEREESNRYAEATGRAQPQPERGAPKPFGIDDPIPFAAEWRG
jgi:hypothetical protein